MRFYTGQGYLSSESVSRKREEEDYRVRYDVVTVEEDFEADGESFEAGDEVAVVVDGHHRLEAARLDNVYPDFLRAHPEQCWYGPGEETLSEYLHRLSGTKRVFFVGEWDL
jgi:hypothetical protein